MKLLVLSRAPRGLCALQDFLDVVFCHQQYFFNIHLGWLGCGLYFPSGLMAVLWLLFVHWAYLVWTLILRAQKGWQPITSVCCYMILGSIPFLKAQSVCELMLKVLRLKVYFRHKGHEGASSSKHWYNKHQGKQSSS